MRLFIFTIFSLLSINIYASEKNINKLTTSSINQQEFYFSCKDYQYNKVVVQVTKKPIEEKYICTKVNNFSQDKKEVVNNANKDKLPIKELEKKDQELKEVKKKPISYPLIEEVVIFKYKDDSGELRYYMQAPQNKKIPILEVKTIYKITESPGNFIHTFKKPKNFIE